MGTSVGIHFNRYADEPATHLKSHAVVGSDRIFTSLEVGEVATIYGTSRDFRRLAAACIEAAVKGEALEADQAA